MNAGVIFRLLRKFRPVENGDEKADEKGLK